jgi:hypothetical protein
MSAFQEITAALDAAVGSDEIVLGDGTFHGLGNVNLRFFGKAVTLRSQSGDPAASVIDCEMARVRGLQFDAGETRSTRVESITVKNSYLLENCPGGGGAYCHDSSPTLHNCVFYMNGNSEGGAIWSSGWATLHIVRTVFHANIGTGSALWCHDSTVELTDCTLFFNLGEDAQVRLSGDSHLTADHTIIAFGYRGTAVQCLDGSTATLSCCDVYGNDNGDWIGCLAAQETLDYNLWADPIFCSMSNVDPHLRADSPCAEENNPDCGQIGALGIACDAPVPVPIRTRSWGQIKAIFRDAISR